MGDASSPEAAPKRSAPNDPTSSDEALIEDADAAHRRVCSSHRQLFSLIAEVDRRQAWQSSGARDTAHWLWMRYGISDWKARRWIAAAYALEQLPAISEAFAAGELGVDKVVELTRLARPATEARLVSWAGDVSCGAIRHEADLALRPQPEDARSDVETRRLSWWYHGETHRRFGMYLDAPAAHGAVVAKAIERVAAEIPVLPGE